MDISKIDKNFAASQVDENGFRFVDVTEGAVELEGLPWFEENGRAFYRLPKTLTKDDVNEGALYLANHTSGVSVRFRTDSPEIMLRAKPAFCSEFGHMARTASSFDSFRRQPGGVYLYNSTLIPAGRVELGKVEKETEDLSGLVGVSSDREVSDWIINFPLYGGVEKVELGFKADSVLLPPVPRKVKDPVLFYGSSITQGGCASRPGNNYSAMLCREVDAPQINLGFSGCGRGEKAVAEAIASLKLSAFVMDYDHNAPDAEYLEATHEKFFKTIREKQPELPVIMLSKPDFQYVHKRDAANDALRREVIKRTYANAVAAGDKNVYFIDGETLFGTEHRDLCTVDRCHPNDLGFYRMFCGVLPVLKKVLGQ